MAITDYQIVQATNVPDLVAAVQAAIRESWQPVGELILLPGEMAQTPPHAQKSLAQQMIKLN